MVDFSQSGRFCNRFFCSSLVHAKVAELLKG